MSEQTHRDPDRGLSWRHPNLPAYVATFGLLLLLTTGTFALSFLPHAAWTIPVTVLIALVKATLVALVFMHLIEEPPSSWASVVVAVLLAATLIVLAMLDVASRWLLLRGR